MYISITAKHRVVINVIPTIPAFFILLLRRRGAEWKSVHGIGYGRYADGRWFNVNH